MNMCTLVVVSLELCVVNYRQDHTRRLYNDIIGLALLHAIFFSPRWVQKYTIGMFISLYTEHGTHLCHFHAKNKLDIMEFNCPHTKAFFATEYFYE